MDKQTQIAVAALGALGCGAAVALSQSRPPLPAAVGKNMDPQPMPGETQEQLTVRVAHLWAVRAEVARLDAAASAALDAGDAAGAEAEAQQSVALGVESGWGREMLARALFEQGKDQEALQVYQEIAKAGVTNAHNQFPYALLLLKAGRWVEAVTAYNQALQLGGYVDPLQKRNAFSPDVPQPQDLEASIRMGLGVISVRPPMPSCRRLNEFAMDNFRQALALTPDSALAHFYYGYGLRMLGQHQEAQAAFAKATQLGGDDVKAEVAKFSK